MGSPKYIRPQKHNSWFNVMPVRDFARLKSPRVPFLDSFVTVEAAPDEPELVQIDFEKGDAVAHFLDIAHVVRGVEDCHVVLALNPADQGSNLVGDIGIQALVEFETVVIYLIASGAYT